MLITKKEEKKKWELYRENKEKQQWWHKYSIKFFTSVLILDLTYLYTKAYKKSYRLLKLLRWPFCTFVLPIIVTVHTRIGKKKKLTQKRSFAF